MPSYAIKSSGIRQVAANSLIGNSTGSTGSAEELSATDAKTLLGLGTTDSPTFASATIGNMTLSDAGSYDSITSGDARLALRAQDGSMELYLENASDGNDSFRFNTANGIFELFSDADNQIDLRNGTSPNSLNIFNSWTDSSNSEGFKIDWQTLPNYCLLETFATGTGVAREMRLQAAAGRFYLKASGSTYAVVTDGNGNEKYDFIDGTFSSRSTANLGSTTSRWSSLYATNADLSGDLDFNGVASIFAVGSDLDIFRGASRSLRFRSGQVKSYGKLTFNGTTLDIGTSIGDQAPRTIYLNDTLSVGNSTTTGTAHFLNSFTDSSNYERGFLKWDSSAFKIGTESAGTGTGRSVELVRNGVTFLELKSNSSVTVYTSLYPSSSGSLNNGFSSLRWANVYSENADLSEALTLASHTPATTTNKLYNVSGSLYFNGSAVGGGGNPFDQDLNTTDSPTFDALTTTGDANISNSNTGKVTINGTTYGIKRSGTGFGFLINNEHRFVMKTDRTAISGVYSGSTPHYFGFTNTTHADTASSAVDVRLQREAANHLAMVNSTNAQTFSVAGTYTDSSNYERLKIEAGTAYNIRVQAAGTGTGRDLNIHSGASAALRLGVDGTNYIIMTSSGVKPAQDLFPNANDSYKNGTTSNRWSETNTVDLNSTGDINFSGLPTSSSGLSTGDLYLQSSGVPGGDYQIMIKT